jgi:transposase
MGQNWAKDMKKLILDIKKLTYEHGGMLTLGLQEWAREQYRKIVAAGIESTGGWILKRPPGEEGKRGKIAKPKYRNLLERLHKFEDDVLRFMTHPSVPFSNNSAERPIRMVKALLKISGCFKSLEFAQGFCTMRGYLVSCQRNGVNAYKAISMLVEGQTPAFITERLARDKDSVKAA